jgi:hypothetical protein
MSNQNIAGLMKELKGINNELERINKSTKGLRDRKKKIETYILDYLENNDQPGIKYEDLIVLRHQKKKRLPKAKEEKKEDVIRILEDNGIENSIQVYNDILENMKGEEEKIASIKIKKDKDRL